MPKTRINISLDHDLAKFIKLYVKENRTTVADVFTQFLLSLKRHEQGESTEFILSDPNFRNALFEVQSKLRKGQAEWHSFEEVFGE